MGICFDALAFKPDLPLDLPQWGIVIPAKENGGRSGLLDLPVQILLRGVPERRRSGVEQPRYEDVQEVLCRFQPEEGLGNKHMPNLPVDADNHLKVLRGYRQVELATTKHTQRQHPYMPMLPLLHHHPWF